MGTFLLLLLLSEGMVLADGGGKYGSDGGWERETFVLDSSPGSSSSIRNCFCSYQKLAE